MKAFKYIILTSVITLSSYSFAQETLQDSLSLRSFLNRVEKNNLSLLAERYNVNIADAEVAAAKVMPDPEVTFEVHKEEYHLELGYTLELGNKRGARVSVAKSERDIAQLSLENYFQELRAESTMAFIDAVMNRELLKVKEQSYKYIQELNASDSIRLMVGEIDQNDWRQTKLEVTTMLNEVYQQEAEYKASLALLNQYMGEPGTLLHVSRGKWQDFNKEYVLGDLIPTAMHNRIDVMLATKETELVNNQLRLAKRERLIDIDLMVGYERDWHGLWPNRETIKAGVTVPLPFSNFNKGTLKAAKFAQKQKEYETRNTKLEIETEVTQAFFFYEAAKKQVNQFKGNVLSDSEKVLESMVYQYMRGEASILEVLVARRTNIEVQEQYIEALRNYAHAIISLEKSCGVWSFDI